VYPSHIAVHYNGINLVYTVCVQQLTQTLCIHLTKQFIIMVSTWCTMSVSSS